MSDKLARIKNTIKALLSMTTENGCTEAEAMAAITKAQKLMAEYNIELSENTPEFTLMDVRGFTFTCHRKKKGIERYFITNVAKFCNCRLLFATKSKGFVVYPVIGAADDLEFFNLTMNKLLGCIKDQARAYVNHRQATYDRGERKIVGGAFANAMAVRLNQRIREILDYSTNKEPGTDLIVAKQNIIELAVQYAIKGVDLQKKKVVVRYGDAQARAHGRMMGDNVAIQESFNAGSKSAAKQEPTLAITGY